MKDKKRSEEIQRRNLAREIATACDKVEQAYRTVDAAHEALTNARWDRHKAQMALRRFEDLTASQN